MNTDLKRSDNISSIANDIKYELDRRTEKEFLLLSKAIDPKRRRTSEEISKNLALISGDYISFQDTCSGGSEYTPKDINANREKIRSRFIKFKDTAFMITSDDLRQIVELYDTIWFNSRIIKYFKDNNYTLDYVTETGDGFGITGLCTNTCAYTITIPAKMFKHAVSGTIVAGLKCTDSLDCLMRVVEHEMTHLIIFTFCTSEYLSDQHSPLFTSTTKRLFGHTHFTHQISSHI